MRVLYYALGGGHGHVLRGLAILKRLGHGTLLGPARLADWAARTGVPYLSPPTDDPRSFVGALPPPGLLLVDVFPRGVVGDLVPLLGLSPAWLVSRWVRPAYYLHPPVKAALESRFERILWGEDAPPELEALAVPRERVGPILLRPPRLPRAEARRILGAAPGKPVLLGLGGGEAAAQARLSRLLGKVARRLGLQARFVSHELEEGPQVVRYFPAASLLAGADVVVAAGGYHAFHETREAGVPTVYVPQARLYDDQFRRAGSGRVARSPGELESLVRSSLEEGLGGAALSAWDGAERVARLVEGRVEQGVLGEEEVAALAR